MDTVGTKSFTCLQNIFRPFESLKMCRIASFSRHISALFSFVTLQNFLLLSVYIPLHNCVLQCMMNPPSVRSALKLPLAFKRSVIFKAWTLYFCDIDTSFQCAIFPLFSWFLSTLLDRHINILCVFIRLAALYFLWNCFFSCHYVMPKKI